MGNLIERVYNFANDFIRETYDLFRDYMGICGDYKKEEKKRTGKRKKGPEISNDLLSKDLDDNFL